MWILQIDAQVVKRGVYCCCRLLISLPTHIADCCFRSDNNELDCLSIPPPAQMQHVVPAAVQHTDNIQVVDLPRESFLVCQEALFMGVRQTYGWDKGKRKRVKNGIRIGDTTGKNVRNELLVKQPHQQGLKGPCCSQKHKTVLSRLYIVEDVTCADLQAD